MENRKHKLKPSTILGINIFLSLVMLGYMVEGVIALKKREILSDEFNEKAPWKVVCKVSDNELVIYRSKDGLDNRRLKSFTDKNGCEIKQGDSCIAKRCPKPNK